MSSMCSKDLRGDALEDRGDLPWILGGDFERVLCVCASLALSLHIMRRNPLVYAPIYTHTSKFTRIRANIRAYTPTYVYTHQYKHIRAIGPYLLIYSAYTRYCTRWHTHTYTHARARAHTHTHTHTHTWWHQGPLGQGQMGTRFQVRGSDCKLLLTPCPLICVDAAHIRV